MGIRRWNYVPGCCCGDGATPPGPPDPPDPPITSCAGCVEYLQENYLEEPANGEILSVAGFMFGYPFWDLTPFQNIIETHPHFRCGFWKIEEPDEIDPIKTIVPGLPTYTGCIDSNGNLVGLPEYIFIGDTNGMKVADYTLSIAAPRIDSNQNVIPHEWPLTPGSSSVVSRFTYSALRIINFARTRPQELYAASRTLLPTTPPGSYYEDFCCPGIQTIISGWTQPGRDPTLLSDFRGYFDTAISIHPLKINYPITNICTEIASEMDRRQQQFIPSGDLLLQIKSTLDTTFSGIPFTGPDPYWCNYAYGVRYPGSESCYGAHLGDGWMETSNDLSIDASCCGCDSSFYTVMAWLLCWGVTSRVYRDILRNADATEIGIGHIGINNPQSALGPNITSILTGAR